MDKLSSQAADAVDALEAHTVATEKAASEDPAVMSPSDAAREIVALNQKLEETLEMAAAATEMAESEAAERKKLSAELQESASREKELRLLAENAIAAATSSAKARGTDESEAASAAVATACEERRVAVERSEALQKELLQLKAIAEEERKDIVAKLTVAEEQCESLTGKLMASTARAEAAEQRAADLDASLATSSASDSAALSAVRSELSERCHTVTKLERELKDMVVAKDSITDENKALSQSLESCQAELKTTLEEAIETRISLDALNQELEHAKAAAANDDSAEQRQAQTDLATELAEAKQSLAEAVECGEAAADALTEIRLLSKGRWEIGDACEVVITADREADSDAGAATSVDQDKTRYAGTIRFLGEAALASCDEVGSSMWVGVELSAPVGRNDGSVRGVRYFDCAPHHGVMIRPDRLLLPKMQAFSALSSASGCNSQTDTESLREQVASMTADLKRATQSRRQADATRKQLEASLSDAKAKIDSGKALLAEEQSARSKADARAVTLSQEVARVNEEVKRLQGYLGIKSSGSAEKRAAGMTLEEREAAVLGRERLLDERQAAIDASRVAKEALDEQSQELAAREAELTARAARIADERAELENARAFLEDYPATTCTAGAESNASAPNDEQSRRAAAWQQKRTQEMMTLKRRNQTLEAGAERLKTELESARAETEAVKGQLEAEVASSKARNSSTWRLRQENERLQKAEAAWKEKQAYAAGSDGAKMVGMGSATSDDAISATEVQALHAKVRNTPPLLCVLLILVLLVVSERSNFECVR